MQIIDTTAAQIIDRSHETTLLDAHRQWAKRPADERHYTLDSAERATREHAESCRAIQVDVRKLEAGVIGDEVIVRGQSGVPARLTHHAFGQLAARAHAPAGYLRTLPPELAADCLNQGFGTAEEEEGARMLVSLRGNRARMLAVNSDKYVRVWNHDLVTSLQRFTDSAPGWGAPEAFRTAAGGKGGDTLPLAYVSDHDAFFFLVDYTRPIEVEGATLVRGFFLSNSEVGAGSIALTTFLFDYACSNSIVWGAQAATEIRIRHVGDARRRALSDMGEVQREVRALTEASADATIDTIRNAQRTVLGKDREEVVTRLFKQRIPALTKSALEDAFTVAEKTPRYGDPRSVWGVVNGLTEVSQRTRFADERIALDRAAGAVLEMAF